MWIPIPKNKILQFKKLSAKKHRVAAGLFLVEGTKCVLDTVNHFPIHALIATPHWLEQHYKTTPHIGNIFCAEKSQLSQISSLTTTSEVIAVYKIPENTLTDEDIVNQLTIVLDCIQDPGNLGTIIRIADWFGIKTIIASPDSVDAYNPKTIQATMGSISRVKVCYVDIPSLLNSYPEIPSYGTFLNGKNIYDEKLPNQAFIVMGNEGSGISEQIGRSIDNRITIPSFQTSAEKPESLNVGMATAITISEFKRKNINHG